MAELKATAQAETEAVAKQHHQQLTDHVRTVREHTQMLLTSRTIAVGPSCPRPRATAEDVQARAHALLDAAEKDAVQTRQRAEEEAQRLLETAPSEAQAQEERAKRRLADAESGAKLIRETGRRRPRGAPARDVRVRPRDAGRGDRRCSPRRGSTPTRLVRGARTARQRRAQKSPRLRGVATTSNEQLGHLSGVIEALAVPDEPGNPHDDSKSVLHGRGMYVPGEPFPHGHAATSPMSRQGRWRPAQGARSARSEPPPMAST